MGSFEYDPLTGLRKNTGRPFAGAGPQQQMFGMTPSSGGGGRGGLAPTSAARSYDTLLTLPGSKPDFLGLLNADPILSQFKSGLGAEGVADRASRDAAIQKALIGFGRVPDLDAAAGALGLPANEVSSILSPETSALAAKNTEEGLSLLGKLLREFNRGKQNIADSLAARGGLRSGAHGIALKDLAQDRKVAESDATNQILEMISGFQAGLAEKERQRARDLAAAQTDAAGRIPPDQLAGTPAAQAIHLGNGIYRKPDGSLVNADGSPHAGAPPRSVVDGRIANIPEGYISPNVPPQAPPTVGGGPRFYTYKDDVPLAPGQKLGFTSGRGYYAR